MWLVTLSHEPATNYRTTKADVSVSVYVCPSIPVPNVHSTDFTLGGRIAEEPRKCSIKGEFGRMSTSKQSARSK